MGRLKILTAAALLLLPACGGTPSGADPPKAAVKAPVKAEPTLNNDIGMKFNLMKAGEFTMGSPKGEAGRDADEAPHSVKVERFYMATTEVTQAQWDALMPTNPSKFKGPKLPVESVGRAEVAEFAAKLSKRDGRTYRLPTEAEWEYACRAGTTTPYGIGEVLTAAKGNVRDQAPGSGRGLKTTWREKTIAVGSLKANAWGLHDMHGNVWEWVSDSYGPYDKAAQKADQKAGAVPGVLRGGAWNFNPGAARCATRFSLPADKKYDCNGFRLVAEVE